ncbi:MAG: toprim domain-containing protein [Alphaproteobacteria bacterium]|nr:toprim domain-containing protein [Alphaproteobacteria bacterium]
MARIAESELERLKVEVSVARLVEGSGIRLQKRGRDLVGPCPFHEDATPSLTVTPEKNLFHCFGCGIGGGPIDWVMKKNGVSFRHAVELLREGLGTIAEGAVKRTTVRALPPPVSFDADDQALLDQVTEYYHQTLKASPEALAYLQARGLADPALIDTFKLGYANRTLGLRLPNKQRKDGAEIRARLERIGIYRESGHEHFNGSLVFPVLDGERHTTEMYGRKIIDNLRAGTPKHLYLPGPHKGVWNLDGLKDCGGEVILTEALIDAATFWCAGNRNVTAAYGVEGFTADHLAAFKSHGVARVVIAFDRDEAGERGAEKIAAQLMAAGIGCYRMQFPKGLDANAYALKVTPAAKSLGVLIRKAEWLGNGAPPSPPGGATPPDDVPAPAIVVRAAPPVSAAKEKLQRVAPAETSPIPAAAAAGHDDDPAPAEPSTSSLAASNIDATDAGDDTMLPARAGGEAPADDIVPTQNEREVTVTFGDRRYRVRGLAKNTSYEVMRVNVLARNESGVHVDTFDLYAAKSRQLYAKAAAAALESEESIVQRDLGRLLLKLEELQDAAIQAAMKPTKPTAAEIAKGDEEAALAFLRDPQLIERLTADFDRTGLVGEPTNALVGYLAAISRKLATPLAIIVQSTSAAGKSALMEAVLRLVPDEDRVHYSAMTGQSLFYLGEKDLKHKILAIAEEEGVRQAAYALKLLQSQGELTIASTGKDPDTGLLVTQEYHVEGPVMLFLTTTAIDLDEELLNRCLVLSIDESRAQTRAIQQRQRQRRTLAGLLADAQATEITKLHRNVQRLLKPLAVVNPYADQLTFLDERTRTRRDHQKYLTLIDAIALLHQHQREVKTIAAPRGNADDTPGASTGTNTIAYIEVTPPDIALANRLAHEVLGRSIDELPPQTRSVLGGVCALVAEKMKTQGLPRSDVRFTRRELRERMALSNVQIGVHLARLVAMEYVLAHRGGRGTSLVYELLFDGTADEAGPRLPGLIAVETLHIDAAMTADRKGERAGCKGPIRPQNGGDKVGVRTLESARNANNNGVFDDSDVADAETAHRRTKANGSTFPRSDLRSAGGQAPAQSPSLAASSFSR